MLTLNEIELFENNHLLYNTLIKIIETINGIKNKIIFINISYESEKKDSPYAGMEYAFNLRNSKKDIEPLILYYGFESIERLKLKSIAAILDDPGIEYIQMPFRLEELKNILDKFSKIGPIKEPFSKKTKKALLNNDKIKFFEELSLFAHDLSNGITYLVSQISNMENAFQKNNPISEIIAYLKNFEPDFITKKQMKYESIRKNMEANFKKNMDVRKIPKNFADAVKKYEDFYRILNENNIYDEKRLSTIIEKGKSIKDILMSIETTLKGCRKK